MIYFNERMNKYLWRDFIVMPTTEKKTGVERLSAGDIVQAGSNREQYRLPVSLKTNTYNQGGMPGDRNTTIYLERT